MDMPPSRYKVVEEGRRLVVVDRVTGERVRHQLHEKPHRPDMPTMDMGPARTGMRAPDPAPRPRPRGAGTVFTTASWYDSKAPRTLSMNDDMLMALTIGGAVALVLGLAAFFFMGFVAWVVVAVVLGQKGVRASIRSGVTGWLDGLDQA